MAHITGSRMVQMLSDGTESRAVEPRPISITLTYAEAQLAATAIAEARKGYIASLHNLSCEEYRDRIQTMLDASLLLERLEQSLKGGA
jgi:hypothetical protein